MDNYNYNEPYQESGSPGMAKTAFILGICSLLFSLSGMGITFAVMGIIFALLSRGSGKIQKSAKNGIRLSIVGLIIGCIVLISSLVYVGREISKMDWNDIRENYEDILPDDSGIPSDDTPSHGISL